MSPDPLLAGGVWARDLVSTDKDTFDVVLNGGSAVPHFVNALEMHDKI